MGRKRMAGLRFRGGCWHIQKSIKGYGRLYESTGTSDLEEAQRQLVRRLEEIRAAAVYGVRPRRTWRQAATRYLEEHQHKVSIADDALHLAQLDPYIGDLWLDRVHMGTLQRFVDERLAAGRAPKSVNLALGVVRRILNLAARLWRDTNGLTWLETPPMLVMLPVRGRQRRPYPLSRDEWRAFCQALPAHLARMALFKLHTGLREQEVCGLRWEWECQVPELGTSVFLIPGGALGRKNGEDRLVVLNRVARSVIESVRGQHGEWVFTFNDHRVGKMNNSAWRRAWRAAGLPTAPDILRGPHNLRHTCGRWLRSVGVPVETRKAILGHTVGDLTTHYSAPEIAELEGALNRLCEEGEWGKFGALTVLKRKAATVAPVTA